MKWYLLGGIVLLFIIVGIAGGGDDDESSNNTTGSSSSSSGSSNSANQAIPVGSSGTVNDRKVTLRDVATTQSVGDNPYLKYDASEGATLVLAEVKLENLGSDQLTPSSSLFELEDDAERTFQPHTECSMAFMDEAFSFSQIGPGLSRTGVLCFEVPASASLKELRFTPTMFSSRKLVFDMSSAL